MSNVTAIHPFLITEFEKYFNTVFLSAVIVVTIIGNVIALHAFFVTSTLKKPTYYFIACLCISDIMVATLSMPLWITDVLLGWDESNTHLAAMRSLYVKIDLFCGTWAIMSLAIISIERYICIAYALRYFQIMTKNRVYLCFVFLLTYATLTVGITNVLEKYVSPNSSEYFIVAASFIVPGLIKLFSYSQIYVEARKHSKQITELKIYAQTQIAPNDNDDSSSLTSDSSRKQKHSGSTASQRSWTCSPLARKRQCTQNRILVLSDEDEDDILNSKASKDDNQAVNKKETNYGQTAQCCYKLLLRKTKSPKKSIIKILTPSNSINSFEQPLTEKKQVLVRQNTNGSMNTRPVSFIVEKMEDIKEEMNSCDTIELPALTNNNHTVLREESNSEDLNQSNRKISLGEDEEKRKRSFSCPVQVGKKTRLSLEPNDALLGDLSGDESPSLNRMSKIINKFSKWSPSSSPISFRKSFRKNNIGSSSNVHSRHIQKIRRFKRELRAAKVVALIMGTFFLCWAPFMILIILNASKLITFHQDVMRWIMISKDLHYVNSAINPVLYVVLNKVYREAIVRLFQKLKKVKRLRKQ